MKKLLLILLPVTLFLVSCGGGEDELQPVDPPTLSLEEKLVDVTWKLNNISRGWFFLKNNNNYLIKDSLCDTLKQFGTWELQDSLLITTSNIGPLEYINYITILECNDSILKLKADTSTSLNTNVIFEATEDVIRGCMDSTASNFNADAECPLECIFYGCLDSTALNYNINATIDDGSCCFIAGCMDPVADNFEVNACQDDGSCLYYGCNDSTALNYDPIANYNDGSCCYIAGCIDINAFNFDVNACQDDGSCIYKTYVPDDNFEQKLIDLGFDDIIDDYVLTSNIDTITFLDLSNTHQPINLNPFPIHDLSGIEDFLSLIELYANHQNISNINLSNLTNIEKLELTNNNLSNINLSNLTNIEKLEIGNNNLSNINLSSLNKLSWLRVDNNMLSSIDVSYNTQLYLFTCTNNIISSFDLSNNILLHLLSVGGYSGLSNLDLSNNIDLRSFYVYSNSIQNLDLSNNTLLYSMRFDVNNLVGLDLSNNNLNDLILTSQNGNNSLISLDLGNGQALTELNTSGLLSLYCIQVGNISWANSIPNLTLEPQHYFNTNCP